MHILVTGGAGYIGSFMTKRLLDAKYTVTVVDSLERGNKNSVDSRAELLVGSLMDEKFVTSVFNNKYDGVIHFAGYISMGESMQEPQLYFANNTFVTLQLLEAMRKNHVNTIIFSSTAGVYGNPSLVPIPEDHPKNPTNPYGESKLMVEHLLTWYNKIFGIRFASLRYFNAAGAALDGSMGEDHHPESHIIPLILQAAKDQKPFKVFGTDYNTPDGTCVRDYIHVLDLVESHILALHKLQEGAETLVYNIGTGKGYSNKEVIDMVKSVSGLSVAVTESPRRPGDADTLVSSPSKIQKELGFSPKYSDLQTIVESAWKWHSRG